MFGYVRLGWVISGFFLVSVGLGYVRLG